MLEKVVCLSVEKFLAQSELYCQQQYCSSIFNFCSPTVSIKFPSGIEIIETGGAGVVTSHRWPTPLRFTCGLVLFDYPCRFMTQEMYRKYIINIAILRPYST